MKSVRKFFIVVGLFIVVSVSYARNHVQEATGAGSSFIYPVLAKWAQAYQEQTGIEVNYQPIGSGGGLQQIYSGTVNFAATDMPLSPTQLNAQSLVQFPAIIGGIVPIINLKGVTSNEMTLDGSTLVAIYSGTIKYWDDPKIAALNPNITLPHHQIISVHRADGSGTTFNFTHYLSQVSATWNQNVGFDTIVEWPGFGIGAKGNAGVASQVSHIPYSIGYVEFAFAKQTQLAAVKLKNKAGKIVSASESSFTSAAKEADWKSAASFNLILSNQPGESSWPILATTFVLVSKKQDSEITDVVLKFFDWSYANGGSMARELDYVAIPRAVVDLVKNEWKHNLPSD